MKTRYLHLIVLIVSGVLLVLTGWFYTKQLLKPSNLKSDIQKNQQPITIVALGDVVCEPENPTTNTTCRAKSVAKQIKKINPSAVLLLGDLQYWTGALTDYKVAFAKVWADFEDDTIVPSPGNHEYKTENASGYYQYFGKRAGDKEKGYYAKSLGSWLILALNSNCEYIGGCDKNSPQAKWLERKLDLSGSRCTLAYWHHPLFTSGPHNDLESTQRSRYFWQLLSDKKADIILNGHDHLYERFNKQDDTGSATKNGVRQFTVGTGGKSLYEMVEKAGNQAYIKTDSFGFLKLNLYQSYYSWQFISESGETLDQGTGNCNLKQQETT